MCDAANKRRRDLVEITVSQAPEMSLQLFEFFFGINSLDVFVELICWIDFLDWFFRLFFVLIVWIDVLD